MAIEKRRKDGLNIPHDTFTPILYRQPALVEGALRPEAYRHRNNESDVDVASNEINNVNIEEVENQIDLLLEGNNHFGKEATLSTPLRNNNYI